MKNDIIKLLQELRYQGMLQGLEGTLEESDREGHPPAWAILQLIREEYRYRQERRQAYRLAQAKLPWDWTLETFPFERQPGVRAQQIHGLANLDFIERAQNLVLIGPPGTGKSGLAIGLLRQALLNGYRVRFYSAQNLIDDLYASLADRSTTKLLNQLANYDLLAIDELGYLTLKAEQTNAFFKLLDQRYGQRSTIITTNLDYDDWYGLFQRKTLVDAMLDRLKHHCITIRINGPSLREPDVPDE